MYRGYRIAGTRKRKLIEKVELTIQKLMKKNVDVRVLCKWIGIHLKTIDGKWTINWDKYNTKQISGVNSNLLGYL
jgi:hypothetical protein